MPRVMASDCGWRYRARLAFWQSSTDALARIHQPELSHLVPSEKRPIPSKRAACD